MRRRTPDKPLEVTTTDLCRIVDLTRQRVAQLVAEGMPKSSVGRFVLAEAVPWYVRRLRDERSQRSTRELEDARVRLVQEQTRSARLDNLRRSAELVEAEVVRELMAAIDRAVWSELERLVPDTLAAELADLTDPATIQGLLFDAGRATRAAIAGRIAALV